jgi:hypothetical protein
MHFPKSIDSPLSFVVSIASVGQPALQSSHSGPHVAALITGSPLNLSGMAAVFLGKAMVLCFWSILLLIISNIQALKDM